MLVGCQKVEPKEERILCAGDSITYGYLLDKQDSYPAILQSMCQEKVTVLNTSTVGITAYDYQNMDLLKQGKDFEPTIVVLMFGSNDSNLYYYESREAFKTYYTHLIEQFSQSKVYLCTPPMAYSDNYGVNEKNLKEIVETIKEIGKEKDLKVIDIYSLTSKHSEWFSQDGIHPDRNGTKAIAQAVYEAIQ